jgi:hypothetical protein
MPADDITIIACPSCSQKYRVPPSRIGHHAVCKKCGQRFKIARETPGEPVDEDTLFGWIMEGDDASESVMGSTSIFEPPSPVPPPPQPATPRRPPTARSARPKPPDKPRVKFDRIDEIGAYFEFASTKLSDPELRMSFPHRCVGCLGKERLDVHLVIWGDQLPSADAIQLREAEVRMVRSYSSLKRQYGNDWFDHLDRIEIMPPPYNLPFPYFVCKDCTPIGAVTCHVLHHGGREFAQLAIANLTVALDFYRNNGGRESPGYQRLLVASRQQRDNQWTSLPFAVRAKINQWFTIQEGERFLGYFADRDFSRTEAGVAGLILTDRRIVYKKYASHREYDLAQQGSVLIEADRSSAMIEVTQEGQRSAVLTASPLAAGSLAKSLRSLNGPWTVRAQTPPAG